MNPTNLNADQPTYSLKQLIQYFLKLGTLGFGGPIALIGYMYRDLVEERQWISEVGYQEGLTLAQVAPGPLAAQLSFYLGYIHYGVLGSLLVGLAFILPSFLMVVALGWAYTLYDGLSWMQAVFYGVGAAVISIIAISTYKLTRKIVSTNWLLWSINGVTVAATGAIAGAVVVLGRQSLRDLPTFLIALVTLAALWKFGKKLPEPLIITIAAVVGLIVYPLAKV